MDFCYQFFDRSACDELWNLSWKEYLSRWGRTRWAKAKPTGEGTKSLRDTIAFHIDPQPTEAEVERIFDRETVRQTVRKSTPQFGLMADLLFSTPGFRKHSKGIFYKGGFVAVLLAVAVDAYFRGQAPQSALWSVMKLHNVEDPSPWVRISREERREIKTIASCRFRLQPIYRWQGYDFLAEEQWANCLGVADTKRFVKLMLRAWKENSPVPRLRDVDEISERPLKNDPPRFRDFEVSKMFASALMGRVSRFQRPCVFFEWL